jgi:cytochrome c-type biogenesis protein
VPQGAEHISLWIAFSAGVLSFMSPCILPLIPSYLSYITGLTFSQLQNPHGNRRMHRLVLVHTLAFIVGFSAVFIFFGGLAGLLSSSFQSYLREGIYWAQKIGGLLIFLFGVHVSGLFHFGWLLGERRIKIHHRPAGFFGTFVVGVAFAAGWTPCIGPILGSILALAAGSSANAGEGMALLTAYSAGMGVPFLLAALLFHGFLSFFQGFRRYIRAVEIATGILLMTVGSMLFFDLFANLTAYLYRYVPF